MKAIVSQKAEEERQKNHYCCPLFVLASLLFAYQSLKCNNAFHEYEAVATCFMLWLNSALDKYKEGTSIFPVISLAAAESHSYTIPFAKQHYQALP